MSTTPTLGIRARLRIDVSRDRDVDDEHPAIGAREHRFGDVAGRDDEMRGAGRRHDDVGGLHGADESRQFRGAPHPDFVDDVARALKRAVEDDDLRDAFGFEPLGGKRPHLSGAENDDRGVAQRPEVRLGQVDRGCCDR